MDKTETKPIIESAYLQGNFDAEQFNLSDTTPSTSKNFRHRLWSIEAQLAPLTFEVAFLYSEDGVECTRVKGNATTIQIKLTDAQQERMRGGILTHNHPDGSFFSLADVRLAYKLNLTELRVVRKGNPIQVISTFLPIAKWLTQEEFDTYWKREKDQHYQREFQSNREQGMPLQSQEEIVEKANETWPAYFQSKLMECGFKYEEAVLKEPEK